MSIEAVITIFGIPMILGAVIYVAKKLQALDGLQADFTEINTGLEKLADQLAVKR